MKLMLASAFVVTMATLGGCATPPVDPADAAAGSELASMGTIYEDKGETFTGSRIPQKSTTHVLKRVGNADYKKMKADANSGNVKPGAWGK